MIRDLSVLLVLSTLMATTSFLTSYLPLTFTPSQQRLRLVANARMGLLTGTALIVLIPEGVEALYSSRDYRANPHLRRARSSWPGTGDYNAASHTRRVFSRGSDEEQYEYLHPSTNVKANDDKGPFNELPGPAIPGGADVKTDKWKDEPPKTLTTPEELGILGEEHPKILSPSVLEPPLKPQHPHSKGKPSAWIGIPLILGFVSMYVINTLLFLRPPGCGYGQDNIYSLSDPSISPTPSSSASPQRPVHTLLRLCIQAAADGIALGASSISTSPTFLSLNVFGAIMINKAPATFGLNSILLKQGLGKGEARVHLLISSLAAPVAAVCTWILVSALGGGGNGEHLSMRWWTGVLLLFSGGTFLYSAMHTIQEEDIKNLTQEDSNGYLDVPNRRQARVQKGSWSLKLILAAVGGMLIIPLLTLSG